MAEYHLLKSKEHDEENATPSSIGLKRVESKLWKRISTLPSFWIVCCIVITIVACVGHNFFSNEAAPEEDLSFLTPPGPIPKTFTIDKRFRLNPSPEGDEAWRSILPNGLGAVQHPALGPEVVSLAFVHQLHCLASLVHLVRKTLANSSRKDMIRKNYFAAQDYIARSETADKHMVHCLDYIRQALQCHADTNLEYRVVSETGDVGFTGYGEHRCRDFERVFRFAEEWRVYEGKNESEWIKVSKEEMTHGRVIDYDYVSSRGDSESIDELAS